MHERKKLTETKYFYSRMVEEQGNRNNFTYNLSAFLSAARSVLQYTKKETKTKPGGEQWYNNRISASPVLRFFKDKRNVNIHTEPIQPATELKLTIRETVHISDSVSITIMDKDGNIVKHFSSDEPQPKPKKPEIPPTLEITYKFDDWAGSEDVLTLCQMYVQELEDIIKDGVRQRFIIG